jgi:hypothetical protein
MRTLTATRGQQEICEDLDFLHSRPSLEMLFSDSGICLMDAVDISHHGDVVALDDLRRLSPAIQHLFGFPPRAVCGRHDGVGSGTGEVEEDVGGEEGSGRRKEVEGRNEAPVVKVAVEDFGREGLKVHLLQWRGQLAVR